MTSKILRDLPPTPGKGWADKYNQSMKYLRKSKISEAKKDLFGEQRLTINKNSEPGTKKRCRGKLEKGLKKTGETA